MELIFIALLAGAFIVFQIFQGRKRRRETENRQTLFVPGVEIMTNYGVYGTIVSIDDDKNLAVIETTPGTQLKIHRQTILKVADYDTLVADDEGTDDAALVEGTDDDARLDTDSSIRHDRARATGADEPQFTEPKFGELRDDSRNPSRPTDAAAKDKSSDQ